jgi:microcystin-dependent protein
MAALQYANNASSLLAASINDTDVVLQVSSAEGALFPSPGVGQYFKLVLQNAVGDLEICHCTSRASDLLTIVRGQEGTSAQSWVNGATRCELRNTAGVMNALLQKTGDVMTGDLNMQDNEVQNAKLTGDTVVTGGQLVGTAVRGALNDASNEIVVPSDGSPATAGGSQLLTVGAGIAEQMPIGSIIMWYGSIGSAPAGWQLCNGANGTPDLRDSFPRGAGGALALGDTGGAATASGNTGASGAHTHTGDVSGHALTVSEMPAHRHRIRGTETGNVSNVGEATADAFAAVKASTGDSFRDAFGSGQQALEDAGAGAAHSHALSSVSNPGSHTHTLGSIATLPPYKAVYFIMKVA